MNKIKYLMFFLALCSGEVLADTQAGPEVGKPMPALMGRILNSKLYRLNEDLGQPKIVNFFSTTCVPCREEMPELARLEKRFPKIKFISVQADNVEDSVVERYLATLPAAPSHILLGSTRVKEEFSLHMGLPHTVVLDKRNHVLLNLIGYNPQNLKTLQQTLQQLSPH